MKLIFWFFQLSGEKIWAQTAVEGFKENCEQLLEKNPNPNPPTVFCPNDCSGNGNYVLCTTDVLASVKQM